MGRQSYNEAMKGSFKGVLKWEQFDALWAGLREQPGGWYVWQPSGESNAGENVQSPPEMPMAVTVFTSFLDEAEQFLRKQQRADYCGAVYADDLHAPTFIKIFHPRKMGSSCGCGGPVLPHWTLSRMPPENLLPSKISTQGKKGLLAGLFTAS